MAERKITQEDIDEYERLLKAEEEYGMDSPEAVSARVNIDKNIDFNSPDKVEKMVNDRIGKKAKDNMINYANDKSANDKIEAVDEVVQGIGGPLAAIAAAKSANAGLGTPEARATKRAEEAVRNSVLLARDQKMAAGAEDNPLTIKEMGINTDGMSALEGINLKNSLKNTSNSMSNDGKFDPNADLTKFWKDAQKEEASKKDNSKKDKYGRPFQKLKEMERIMSAHKAGYNTIMEHKEAGNDSYNEMMKRPTEVIVETDEKPTYAVLENSIKDKNGNVYERRNNSGVPAEADSKSKAREINAEGNGLDKVISFMDFVNKFEPEYAKQMVNNRGDMHLGDPYKMAIDPKAEELARNELEGVRYGRNKDLLQSRKEPIARDILSRMSTEEIIENGKKVFSVEDIDNLVRRLGKGGAKENIARALAALTASFMYSEESDKPVKDEKEIAKETKKRERMTNKIVKANAEQLSGPFAKAWANDKAKMWTSWFDNFDVENMDAEDYQPYLEAYQLLDDYNHGRNIVTNRGNTNGLSELLTNPKYVNLVLKY